MYYCDVEKDCPQADGDEPAGEWAITHDSAHDVLVNKKSNAMLVFPLCPSSAVVSQSSSISFHRVQGCSICTCQFRVLVPGVSLQLLASLCSLFHDQTPKKDILSVQRDWNAKVGKNTIENWQGICGPFCNDDTNERGIRLLEFATFNVPVLANTSGHHKASRRWTWHSPN